MRSRAVAQLLRCHGALEPVLLCGGYKAFQAWTRDLYCCPQGGHCKKVINHDDAKAEKGAGMYDEQWRKKHQDKILKIAIIGGRTGCGKTRVLHELRDSLGQQVLDLEGLANHRGSAFGWCGHAKQPTPEQFENDVAMRWLSFHPDHWIFVEDEGPNVGAVGTPKGLYKCMREASVVLQVKVPMAARVDVLVNDYASKQVRSSVPDWDARMLESVRKLQKRIGPARASELEKLLEVGDYAGFSRSMLGYYDEQYDYHIQSARGTGDSASMRTDTVLEICLDEDCQKLDAHDVACKVLETLNLFNQSKKAPKEFQQSSKASEPSSSNAQQHKLQRSKGCTPSKSFDLQMASARTSNATTKMQMPVLYIIVQSLFTWAIIMQSLYVPFLVFQ
jgi:hypothetical protein